MKRFLLSLGIATTVLAIAPRDAQAAPVRRVVVAGRQGDVLTDRVQKELGAMGFEVIRVEAGEGCSRSAVSGRVRDAAAHAATCTDGDAIGVWIIEPSGLRLRDVIVARTPDEQQRDMAAVRAAETARASIEAVDQEAEAKAQAGAKPTPPPPPAAPAPAASQTPNADRPAAAPAKKDVKKTPAFVIGAGLSTLMGVDASVAAFSAEAEVGITRWLAIAPRLELPIEDRDLNGTPTVKVRPAFTGIGAVIPVTHPGAFVIPRFGAGVGAAWINAEAQPTSFTRFEQDGSFNTFPTSTAGSASTWSLAAYGSAALSMRIFGHARMTVDGVFGTTLSRLVVRTQGNDRAYWGAPFGALALRLEILFP
jgi:hypothetical protein